jgi:hypothetical protein
MLFKGRRLCDIEFGIHGSDINQGVTVLRSATGTADGLLNERGASPWLAHSQPEPGRKA